MQRSEDRVEKFRKNAGYQDLLAAVRRLVRPSHVRVYLDGDGWPTEQVVGLMLRLLREREPEVSRRRRWVEAALWERSRDEAPVARPSPISAACAVLGVSEGAPPEEVRAAYRARIYAAHPDRGGAVEEAQRVNAAYQMIQEA